MLRKHGYRTAFAGKFGFDLREEPNGKRLPMPENEKIVNDDTSQDEVKNLVTSDKKILPSKIKKNTKPTSLEKLIIKKIK